MKTQKDQPIPQGKYIPAVRDGNIIYTSGMTPRKAGKLIFEGKVKADMPPEHYKEAVELATQNALNAAMNCLREGEKLIQILQLNVFLNTEDNVVSHPRIADFASNLIIETLGVKSIGSRAAIGVASLPSNATVEITLTGKVE